MILKRNFISCKALANEWLTDREYQGKVSEDLLYRWASFRAEEIIDTEHLVYGLGIIDIEKNVGDIPDGLHSIYLAASCGDTSRKIQREHFVGYTQNLYGTDCDIKVELLCPKCGDEVCTCHKGKFLDIQVDDLYLRTRPYLWAMSSTGYVGYSAPKTDGFPHTGPEERFQLMRPFAHNDTLWNSEYYLGICNALPQTGCYRYKIDNGKFITDLPEGQVFISYLRYQKDDDGYFMIPNYPVVIRAITAYMDEMVAWRDFMKMKDKGSQAFYAMAKQIADKAMYEAISELNMPSPDEIMEISKKHWHKDQSRFYYG